MASFFNLILDTLAPSGLSILLNDGAKYTTKAAITLKLSLTDSDKTGYQMKIWGVDGAETEGAASYETFSETKQITLPAEDGLKTVYVKVRDDVGNETTAVSATITLNTAVPTVTISGPDKSKISKVSGFDTATFSFMADVPFTEYKVCVVPQSTSLQNAGVIIPTTGGSSATSGTGTFAANTDIDVSVKGADLETASSGDGTKIVKVFVKNEAGTWSIA